MLIQIKDEDLNFTIKGNCEGDIEEKLMTWFLETGNFAETLEIVKQYRGVDIEILDNTVI